MLGFKRGLCAFYEQLDLFLDEAFHSDICGGSNRSKKDRMELREFMIRYRDRLFCRYLPLPSRIAFVVEEEASRSMVDKNVFKCVDAVNTILGIWVGQPDPSTMDENALRAQQRRIEDRTFMAGVQLAEFYHDFIGKTLGQKTGWYRKHVCGSRLNFTFRGVITSIFGVENYHNLHLPWSIGVNIFALHITNKLLKRGYSPRECGQMIARHTNVYHPLLDELMAEIIAEHPLGKFPVIFQRNPTLARLSAQCLYISKVKKDPEDRSIGIGLLVLAGCNADFDGRPHHCRL